MNGATHNCRRCGQPDCIPDVIYDTSDSLRFDPAVRLCLECWKAAKADYDAEDRKKYGPDHVDTWGRAKASGQIPSGEHVFCFIPSRVFKRGGAK